MKDYILGVDLGGTNIKAAAYRLESYEKVGEKRLPTQVEGGWEHVLGRVLAALEELLRQMPRERVLCVGMGVPGLLDIEAGVSRFSPNFPQWEDVPVAAWLGERLGLPVFIDNDVRVNLYGEWLFGAGRGLENLVLLTLGTGLGSGIVLDGRVLYGATASAGEIGHMNMFRQQRLPGPVRLRPGHGAHVAGKAGGRRAQRHPGVGGGRLGENHRPDGLRRLRRRGRHRPGRPGGDRRAAGLWPGKRDKPL